MENANENNTSGTTLRNVQTQTTVPEGGTFLNCEARFDGSLGEPQVNFFIRYISLYKEIEQIPDAQALDELKLLLQTNAEKWWTEEQHKITTWQEAMHRMYEQFKYAPEARNVYVELLTERQGESTPIEWFILRKKALIIQAGISFSEVDEIDLIYPLMRPAAQKFIPRYAITSMNQFMLLAKFFDMQNKKCEECGKSTFDYSERLSTTLEPEPYNDCTPVPNRGSSLAWKKIRCPLCRPPLRNKFLMKPVRLFCKPETEEKSK